IGGRFAGKYNYVSPEQLGLYGGEVSEQSDIYSMGLVLAAALRGNPLDMSGSQLEIVEKRRTVPDLSDIDADFREIIEAMLQPDPKHRPISMAEIARMTRDPDEETRP
ncbi:MAG: serine/threonine protein kinase, partial [Mesorhizobium sp.]